MDRIAAMQAYVRWVELGTFSAVARELHVKQSTISKWVASLEEEYGVQLIERTTRASRTTESGQTFYTRAKQMLALYEDTVATLQDQRPTPKGRVRMSVPAVFGRMYIIPLLSGFLNTYPDIELEVSFNDRYVQLVEEDIDLAIRVGVQKDSTYRAKKLGEATRHLVAAPSYFAQHGHPQHPDALTSHQCLLHTGMGTDMWTFQQHKQSFRVQVRGRFSTNFSEALLTLARDGMGIAMLASWLIAKDIQAGSLHTTLQEYTLPSAPIVALMPPIRYIAPKIRVLLDYLHEALSPLSTEDIPS